MIQAVTKIVSLKDLNWIDVSVYFLLILVATFIAAQFILGIELSTSGVELSNLEKHQAAITQENRDLREDLAMDSSLTLVAEKAVELGLQEPQQVVYFSKGQFSAQAVQEAQIANVTH